LIRAVQTAGVSKYFTKNRKTYGMDAKDLWKHSVAVAVMSQILNRQFYQQEDGALYTAALVHDIRKLIMESTSRDLAKRSFNLLFMRDVRF
jgi:HD-like signal output (HDOD) protein